jgi:hypothetical protein
MEAVESGPVRQCLPGLIYLETVMSRSLDPNLVILQTGRPWFRMCLRTRSWFAPSNR